MKSKKEKLFGFGHRVYRNFDPRAKIIKEVHTYDAVGLVLLLHQREAREWAADSEGRGPLGTSC